MPFPTPTSFFSLWPHLQHAQRSELSGALCAERTGGCALRAWPWAAQRGVDLAQAALVPPQRRVDLLRVELAPRRVGRREGVRVDLRADDGDEEGVHRRRDVLDLAREDEAHARGLDEHLEHTRPNGLSGARDALCTECTGICALRVWS